MFQNQSKLANGNTLTVGNSSMHLSPSSSDVHTSSCKVLLKQDSTISCNSIQSQADRMLAHNLSGGSPRLSNRKGFRQLLHQDSMRSFKSVQSQEPCTCTVTKETSCAAAATGATESSTNSAHVLGGSNMAPERTPFDILTNMEPTLILDTLQTSIALQKATQGLQRQKCTPSTRWKHCAHHCVQILCARALTVMCHGGAVQHRIVSDAARLKILVDALDPNHDPVRTHTRRRDVIAFTLCQFRLNDVCTH